ncbi:ABC transporter ATP-binding protein [Cytobacillus spongiae]|jgi:peptide/nickel transport system ATP-binding protein|uniref:ABC transporter ATP-binding protein n=1 Tax=Cytobacillus spongiae TaxID=2901381 RepID=UPI001F1C3165|nr:ABC transporter ATP-binding protein [Cytobacillus spongiae]UII56271.1 ABC transporter ATP-binding protein [Cytobacillus spongiae]
MNNAFISIQDLRISTSEKVLVRDVHLEINKGEMVGLIGESGSGKSLTARAIMGLLPPNMKVSGKIEYDHVDLLALPPRKRRQMLGSEVGMIFQDYRGSFTPFIKIGKQMVETIRTHKKLSKNDAKQLALSVLREMGLEAQRVFDSYAFQLSGGQVQRAAIATSLALKPNLIICDEMTTALDVISGEKVLQHIDYIREQTGCSVLMITHDLTLAYKRTDRMYVMNQGEIVEEGSPEQIRCHHQHPYTKKLCSCLLALPGEESFVKDRVFSV